MKTILTIGLIVGFGNVNGQTEVEKPTEKTDKMPNNGPMKGKPEKQTNEKHPFLSPTNEPIIYLDGEQQSENYKPQFGHLIEKAGIPVQIGTNFEGNNLFRGFPADNEIAISNAGKIVSVDNATIAYFQENGDSIVKYRLPWRSFYLDTLLQKGKIYDPKVIYDKYNDRYILVNLWYNQSISQSRILLSFSQNTSSDSISWNHYHYDCDSIYNGVGQSEFWFDYPNIAVNKTNAFITIAAFNQVTDTTNVFVKNTIFQLNKLDGYSGNSTIQKRVIKNVLNCEGNNNGTFIPLSDGFQADTYVNKMYFLSNYAGGSSTFCWYELNGSITDANPLVLHTTNTSLNLFVPSFASQFGGSASDRIQTGDCRIISGFVQNGKLHFTFHRSDAGWLQVVYGRIKTSDNTFEFSTWGGSSASLNYMYPSIAPFGLDASDENVMITFARTGPTIYNQVCVVNYNEGWSPSTTIVKQGLGIINLRNYNGTSDTYERIGDYTDIQRKYNTQSCWLVGSYPFDDATDPMPNANHFDQIDGQNAWIAEIGDDNVRLSEQETGDFRLFPNPTGNILYVSNVQKIQINEIQIFDISGNLILNQKIETNFCYQEIDLKNIPSGFYLINVQTKNGKHENFKINIAR